MRKTVDSIKTTGIEFMRLQFFPHIILAALLGAQGSFAEEESGYSYQKPQKQQELYSYNVPAIYDPCSRWNFHISADFLFWQARSDAQSYGVTSNLGSSIDTNNDRPVQGGTVLDMNFDWHPGFKLGIGGKIPRDHWDFITYWTHYISIQNSYAGAPADGKIFLNHSFPVSTSGYSSTGEIYASWKCKFDTIDMSLGRAYYMGKDFILQPCFGLKTAFIKQKSTAFLTAATFGENTQSISLKNSHFSRAIGLLTGVKSDWQIFQGFKLIAHSNWSLLVNHTTHGFKELNPGMGLTTDTTSTVKQASTIAKVLNKEGNLTLRSHVDAKVGFGWENKFKNGLYLDVSTNYEINYWWGQGNQYLFTSNVEKSYLNNLGDLVLHGFTLNLQLGF